ncbi:hypothetical protein ACF8PL_19175 [Delftia sp. WSY_4]|uniref:hypothetical protein n=1 Tax=unclassified Delftia TaxID=2613839 RepID=UPI00370C8070
MKHVGRRTDVKDIASQDQLVFRELLTAARTYYVRTDGSDSNTGLLDNAAGAFATIQRAMDVVGTIDTGVSTVTVQVRAGAYTGPVLVPTMVGAGLLEIVGDTATPANCAVSSTGACFQAADGARATTRGFRVTGFGGIRGIRGGGLFYANMDFGSCSSYHVEAANGGWMQSTGNNAITGSTPRHITCSAVSRVYVPGGTYTLTGSPSFSDAFARCTAASVVQVQGTTFSGSATGSRYRVESNSVIDTFGAGASYLPGNAAGSTATGGQYS